MLAWGALVAFVDVVGRGVVDGLGRVAAAEPPLALITVDAAASRLHGTIIHAWGRGGSCNQRQLENSLTTITT